MISPIKIIGSLVYKTRESLRTNQSFLYGLSACKYRDCFFKNGEFNLWHFPATANEISNTFLSIGKAIDGCTDKFPALFNFMPVEQTYYRANSVNRIRLTYNLAFVAPVSSPWTTEQREVFVFEPVLRPIVDEFMKQISNSGYFDTNFGFIPHSRYEVFTTGDNQDERIKGRYGDYMDAIELHSLQLTLNNLCNSDLKKIEKENSLII